MFYFKRLTCSSACVLELFILLRNSIAERANASTKVDIKKNKPNNEIAVNKILLTAIASLDSHCLLAKFIE